MGSAGYGNTNDEVFPDPSADQLKASKGFRQYDPGVFTNDDAFGSGSGFVVDASNPNGYRQVKLSDLNIGGGGGPSTVSPTGAGTGPGTSMPIGNDTRNTPVPDPTIGGLITSKPNEQTPPQAIPQTPTTPTTPTTGTTGTGTTTGSSTTSTSLTSPIRDALLQRLSADMQPVSLNDSTLGPQFSAFSTLNQQGLEQARDALAERLHAQRQSNGGLADTSADQLGQTAALQRATYGGNLVGNETQARRTDANNLLGLGLQTDTSDLNRNLTSQLGFGDLNLRQMLGTGQLDLGKLQTLLGNQTANRGLDLGTLQTLLQNQQANNVLGYNYTSLGTNMNRDLILNGILGGSQ